MISIYQLKPKFQSLLRPLVRKLHARGVTANQVTLAACAVSLVCGAIVAIAATDVHPAVFWLIPTWMFVRMALNAVDGMLAREFGQASALGAYFNELCDVIADSALFLPFALLPGVWPAVVVLVTLLAVFTEYAGVMAPLIGGTRRYDGPMGKSDRAFVFGLLAAGVALGWLSFVWLNTAFVLLSLLLAWTIWNRVQRGVAAREASEGAQ
ncbi:CDP-alcohol phosphatidyltransferase family protein [Chitinasiproducens palmae]|uniref:CDP-diacylglycerol--glycerol-3-phosphate 3-phosphatidyltransferase n=1 Tax=Chitinasiproducens palmae TaxID=1770053 RepID=A0A1H2PIR5_9BURK|nr:CDP-alcohol phosphatidyltransferase family protein [Chitinasiproducens palmae]SDV46146.1 CDP-diacylglycerol--glycerol-3-phosphate 3-phosphatidyltransferase [Chitinasiproducens palmae]